MKKIKRIAVIAIICLIAIALIYSNNTIDNPKKLVNKMNKALSGVESYRYTLSMNLSRTLEDEHFDMIRGYGSQDMKNSRSETIMTAMNKTVETVTIDSKLYLKESDGEWIKQDLIGQNTMQNNQLLEQQKILLNATNLLMRKDGEQWILIHEPSGEKVIEQVRKYSGNLETIKEDELKGFRITYWIDGDNYYINRIETQIQLEMNLQGLVTPMSLVSTLEIYDYNVELDIQAPI